MVLPAVAMRGAEFSCVAIGSDESLLVFFLRDRLLYCPALGNRAYTNIKFSATECNTQPMISLRKLKANTPWPWQWLFGAMYQIAFEYWHLTSIVESACRLFSTEKVGRISVRVCVFAYQLVGGPSAEECYPDSIEYNCVSLTV